ncbi:ROK family transcriptional regulator [Acidisoma silvae]|uniref:ROK family protein n=1 Tax=Acidisoma silvae TaxID=2802396 RepID=A0A963YWX8_9PROT|nr:ROK family protein [Acidisoma silvae]MCB8877673.1 ROK family protein [Acidisoma silvae]
MLAPLSTSPTGPGAILTLVRSGQAVTRAGLMEITGLSRSTIGQRLDQLLAAGYLIAGPVESSTGGRPAGGLVINPQFGLLLLVAAGASGFTAAIADFCGNVIEQRSVTMDIARGPAAVLGRMQTIFRDLLNQIGHKPAGVKGIGIGLPGPVAFPEGQLVRPPIMTGWDGYRVPDFFAGQFDAPVLVDNDANLMALGEQQQSFPQVKDLLYLKLGTGIGVGLIMDGQLQRGAQGAAGNIGHWFMPPAGDTSGSSAAAGPRLCRCGNQGCLEAYSSGWALCEECGVTRVRDLTRRAADGDMAMLARLRAAGQHQGEALALAVNLTNPAVVVVGGSLAQDQLLAALRETVYRRSGSLATRSLQIVAGPLGNDAGLHGAAHLVSDALLAPHVVDRHLSAG